MVPMRGSAVTVTVIATENLLFGAHSDFNESTPPPTMRPGKGADLTSPHLSCDVTCKITFDLTCRFLMLDMRWKAFDRAMN